MGPSTHDVTDASGSSPPLGAAEESTETTQTPPSEQSIHQFGLHIVQPPSPITASKSVTTDHTVDIVFVHGLGGSAKETWTHPSTNTFWPSWLYAHKGFKNIRVYTFGYDAQFLSIMSARSVLGIEEFAKQLLERMDQHYEAADVHPIFTQC